MADKLEFKSKLGEILEIANEKNNRIKSEEVEKFFEDDHLNEEQMTLVFDYLLSQKIAVVGYKKTGGVIKSGKEEEPYSLEEEKYLKTYLSDLSSIPLEKVGELDALYERAIEGDAVSKARITELYLGKVVEIGKELRNPQVFIGDLIQEGNVSLMVALEQLESVQEAKSFLESEIRQGMQMLIEETSELKNRDQKMVQKVEHLDSEITKLKEDKGREITIEELALHMEIDETEIMEILKLVGEDAEE